MEGMERGRVRTENPLYSDRQGKYGWDVPEGLWQVVYEKEGYQTAKSAELEVLPPHLDVNIPMVSLASPTVAKAYATDDRGLTIEFSKPMIADGLTLETVAITDTDGKAIEGVWEPVDSETDAAGVTLSQKFRFMPTVPWTAGEQVKLSVQQKVLSYANVPMEEDYSSELTVATGASPAADGVEGITVKGGHRTLYVQWKEKAGADLAGVELAWRALGAETFEGKTELEKGVDRATIPSLQEGTAYEVKVSTIDTYGRTSEGILATGKTLAPAAIIPDTEAPDEVNRRRSSRKGIPCWSHGRILRIKTCIILP